MKTTNSKKWRMISGIAGLVIFILVNYSKVFLGLNVLAGSIQLIVNAFVFIAWIKAYPRCYGFEKFVTFMGVVFPPVMATITIWRVILPAIFN
jgi:hypothetical protein